MSINQQNLLTYSHQMAMNNKQILPFHNELYIIQEDANCLQLAHKVMENDLKIMPFLFILHFSTISSNK